MTELERLIELFETNTCNHWFRHNYDMMCFAKYLLANGVIAPPCKVGDTVYCLVKNKILTRKVERIVIGKDGYMSMEFGTTIFESVQQIGKTVFFSREEAEKALDTKGESKC